MDIPLAVCGKRKLNAGRTLKHIVHFLHTGRFMILRDIHVAIKCRIATAMLIIIGYTMVMHGYGAGLHISTIVIILNCRLLFDNSQMQHGQLPFSYVIQSMKNIWHTLDLPMWLILKPACHNTRGFNLSISFSFSYSCKLYYYQWNRKKFFHSMFYSIPLIK